MESAIILGLMSGTSLDGLDLCLTKFELVNGRYRFQILKTDSINYPETWQKKLRSATSLSGEALKTLDIELGVYFGSLINAFLKDSSIQPDYISSHGHTVFHQPDKDITMQIGDGNTIFSETKIPVICDFRSLDVALKGQGAPLVPIGDLHLFNDYVACLNFGGIANISFQKAGKRLAHDICPVNMALSDITSDIDLPFDDGGKMAAQGDIEFELLNALNKIEFYGARGPKSLGIEWYNKHVKSLIKDTTIGIENRLRTMVEHIAEQISIALAPIGEGTVLVTGGGAYNSFLIDVLSTKVSQEIVIPDSELIDFKEALVFAFLGWLKLNDQVNVLRSVTGALKDSSSGIIIK